jgi:hypothetical protein
MARIDHDTRTHTALGNNFDPLPAGWYTLTLDKSALKENGDKVRIATEYTVLDEPYTGRKIFGGFNMSFGPSPTDGQQKALVISKDQLNQLVIACGMSACADTEELHGIAVQGKIKIRPARDGFDASNEIVAFRSASAPAERATASKSKARADEDPPWGR